MNAETLFEKYARRARENFRKRDLAAMTDDQLVAGIRAAVDRLCANECARLALHGQQAEWEAQRG